ncbi:MAG: hypothetical protein QGG84_08435, partial [Rhodospirillales bacterium]|nr:hypothetical protein [Rhodospirillales bacterium]
MKKLFVGIGLTALMLTALPQESFAQQCSVTVGRVVPITGPLLDMGRETPWLDENKLKQINATGGLQVGGKKCMIKYKIFDSKGTMGGSGQAATKAILDSKVDVVFAQGTPDTTNAPSELCERYKV